MSSMLSFGGKNYSGADWLLWPLNVGQAKPQQPRQAPGGPIYPQGTKTTPVTQPETSQRRAAIAGGGRGTALTRSLTGG